MNSAPPVSPETLKAWLHDGREIALLGVREHGQFGESHLFHAVPLPFSRLELDITRLVPRRVRCVVCDKEAARRYLAWETGLAAQLDARNSRHSGSRR